MVKDPAAWWLDNYFPRRGGRGWSEKYVDGQSRAMRSMKRDKYIKILQCMARVTIILRGQE